MNHNGQINMILANHSSIVSKKMCKTVYKEASMPFISIQQEDLLTSCGSISGHLVTIPYQIIKHIPTSALLEA